MLIKLTSQQEFHFRLITTLEPPVGFEPTTVWLQIRSSTTELRRREDYFFNNALKVSAWASTLSIKELILVESIQVESLQVESVEEVEVEFEQEAKVTNAAINNTFFIWYKYIIL